MINSLPANLQNQIYGKWPCDFLDIWEGFGMAKLALALISALLCLSTPVLAAGPGAANTVPQTATSDVSQIAELQKQAQDARYDKDIAEIKASVLQSQTSWFEILTSSMIGLFGIFITVILLHFAFKFSKESVAEAKIAAVEAAKSGFDDERKVIQQLLDVARSTVADIHQERETARELTKDMRPDEAPSDPATVHKIAEIAEAAKAKPRKERTLDDYRALVLQSYIEDDWLAVTRHASAMIAMFDGEADDESMAFALYRQAYALGELKRNAEAILIYDDLVRRFGGSADAALQKLVAMTLFNKGFDLGALDRRVEAIAVYDDVVRRFGDSRDAALQEQVAKALVNKGVDLGALDRRAEGIAAYDEAVRRFGSSEDAAQQEQVATALVNKGVSLGKLDRRAEGIAAFDEVVRRFGGSEDAALQDQVANALTNKGVSLGKLDRLLEAIAAYDDVVRRFGISDNTALQEQVAKALVYKGIDLSALQNREEAIKVYDEVVCRFGENENAAMREQVAKALVNKGVNLSALGRGAEAIASYDEAVRRFGESEDAALTKLVGNALFNKACALALKGQVKACIDNLMLWGRQQGGIDCAAINSDRDFDPIRERPSFKAFMARSGCN